MRFDVEMLRGAPALLAGRLPGAGEVGELTEAGLTESLAAIGQARRVLDASAALIAAEVARRSSRDLGVAGLAQRRGHKDGAGLVEELAGVGRGEAAKLIRVGGLLETAEAVAPVPPEELQGERGADVGDAGDNGERGDGRGAVPIVPPPRDLARLRALTGPWGAVIAVALRNGWLSAAQSDALRGGLGAPRLPQLEVDWRAAALELIADCWAAQWSPEDLARAAERMRAALDTAAACAEARRRYEMRSMKRTVRASGMVHYDVDLDPESDARFYGPIKRLLSPRFGGPRFTSADDIAAAAEVERDPRSNEQLQADTLVELVERAVRTDAMELFKSSEPQVMVALTAAELAKAREAEHARHLHRSGDHTACPTAPTGGDAASTAAQPRSRPPCAGPDVGVAWIDGRDEPITATDALRMICAGGFTPALFDERGQTLDLGKDRRFFTRAQRRALAKRDGGCLHPGCDRPPEDCEAHHINPWAAHPAHRKSEARDGVLLCRRHHKLIHDHGAHIRRRDGDYWLHWPGKDPALLCAKAGLQTQLRRAG